MLREEGGFEYKQSVVNTFLTIIEKIPESTEFGLIGKILKFLSQ